MQFELKISLYDLIDILKEIVKSSVSLDIYLADDTSFENCTVLEYNEHFRMIAALRGDASFLIFVDRIIKIEFTGFHKYKGQSSKIFLVE
jgi:hypothetical protein